MEKAVTVQDIFNQFCKERHAEDKGRNYNLLQEVYANTELFDLSLLKVNTLEFKDFCLAYDFKNRVATAKVDFLKNYALPFPSMFMQLEDSSNTSNCLFLREYEYITITGTLYGETHGATINTPFTIYTDTGEVIINAEGIYQFAKVMGMSDLDSALTESTDFSKGFRNILDRLTIIILANLKALTELPKHTVVADVTKKATYYPRKKASTIKSIRPIYYVLNKEEETHPNKVRSIKACGELHYDHSFHVRSHWRKLHNPSTLGKDRTGACTVQGLTFVKSYLKGEGSLQKRIRVVK